MGGVRGGGGSQNYIQSETILLFPGSQRVGGGEKQTAWYP